MKHLLLLLSALFCSVILKSQDIKKLPIFYSELGLTIACPDTFPKQIDTLLGDSIILKIKVHNHLGKADWQGFDKSGHLIKIGKYDSSIGILGELMQQVNGQTLEAEYAIYHYYQAIPTGLWSDFDENGKVVWSDTYVWTYTH